ncbi:MAG: Na/Pi cotransporter family protein [Deltaproteobacteria bacterium]|nr:Na/Pi cotransporter family protein [Deltaproteobacteria bacterium]
MQRNLIHFSDCPETARHVSSSTVVLVAVIFASTLWAGLVWAGNPAEPLALAEAAHSIRYEDIRDMIIGLLGGLGIFLLGMEFSEQGLKHAAGDKMKAVLSTLTSNRIMALLMGVAATLLLQSSSASTVMLVGFVEATAMNLTQAMGVILGAKIGTTITAQIIAFNLAQYALLLVAAGVLLRTTGKNKRTQKIGEIVLGFGMIFFGLGVMSDSMRPLRGVPEFAEMLIHLDNTPLLGILLATAFTAIVQSSAATIGLAIALCAGDVLSLQSALPIAWGAHIGTCATALLASIGAGRAGKQVAVAHLLLSILGVIIAYPFLPQLVFAAKSLTEVMGSDSEARALANGHMLFTVTTGLLLLPFIHPIQKLAEKLMPQKPESAAFRPIYLNDRSHSIPVVALDMAHREIMRLITVVRAMLEDVMPLLETPSPEAVARMDKEDDKVDILEKAIRPYLAKVAQGDVSHAVISKEHAFIDLVQDLEGIGDIITRELARSSQKLERHNVAFSPEGLQELRNYHQLLMQKFDRVAEAVRLQDCAMAKDVLADIASHQELERALKHNHLERLNTAQKMTVETSAYHLATLNNMRAIRERLDNMARTIVVELE